MRDASRVLLPLAGGLEQSDLMNPEYEEEKKENMCSYRFYGREDMWKVSKQVCCKETRDEAGKRRKSSLNKGLNP